MTTNKPVMKADLEAAVYLSPMVCKAKPKNKKIPITAPALRIPLSLKEIFREKINQNDKVANPNLRITKTNGEEKESAVLTKGKVVPQIKVKRSRDSSALREELNMFQGLVSEDSKTPR